VSSNKDWLAGVGLAALYGVLFALILWPVRPSRPRIVLLVPEPKEKPEPADG